MNRYSNILAINLRQSFLDNAGHDALSIGDDSYTYDDLYEYSLAVSHTVIECNEPGPVAILGRKSFHTYAGICGALLASKAYMPLNINFPVARNKKMLDLSGARIIVADKFAVEMLSQILQPADDTLHILMEEPAPELRREFPEHHFHVIDTNIKLEFPEITSKAEDTAYLLFTSGTTGVPKGVPVSNLNVTSYLSHVLNEWKFNTSDRFSQTFDLTFDLSVHDMMVCWLVGACLCIPADENPLKMAAYIKKQEINVWFSVPSLAILMDKMRLLKKNVLAELRLSFFCGEPLPVSIAEKWQEATGGRNVINLYGPSEATIAISAYEWDDENRKSKDGIVSIGKIFEEQKHRLLDAEMKIQNTKGELCLGGTQIISSYLNDPDLSAKYFIELGENEDKWYRTGDLAEVDEDGDLFFLGRIDSEVKISGFRVNLYEIDANIRKSSGASQVATVLDNRATPRLVTFLSSDGQMDEAELIERCKHELPWYMIPEVIIFVDEMPLNPNGKIDRKELIAQLNE